MEKISFLVLVGPSQVKIVPRPLNIVNTEIIVREKFNIFLCMRRHHRLEEIILSILLKIFNSDNKNHLMSKTIHLSACLLNIFQQQLLSKRHMSSLKKKISPFYNFYMLRNGLQYISIIDIFIRHFHHILHKAKSKFKVSIREIIDFENSKPSIRISSSVIETFFCIF